RRVRKYIGAYLAGMNGADAICFSAGIGENGAEIRESILSNLEYFGIEIDRKKNDDMIRGKEGLISTKDSKIKIFVIPTNEELVLARDTVRVVLNAPLPSK
ncbi:MAG: acetate kinase, partial [Bacteroidota bacterium]